MCSQPDSRSITGRQESQLHWTFEQKASQEKKKRKKKDLAPPFVSPEPHESSQNQTHTLPRLPFVAQSPLSNEK